jgi:hypothetical protein
MNDANWFKVFDDRVATFDGDGLPSYAYEFVGYAQVGAEYGSCIRLRSKGTNLLSIVHIILNTIFTRLKSYIDSNGGESTHHSWSTGCTVRQH